MAVIHIVDEEDKLFCTREDPDVSDHISSLITFSTIGESPESPVIIGHLFCSTGACLMCGLGPEIPEDHTAAWCPECVKNVTCLDILTVLEI